MRRLLVSPQSDTELMVGMNTTAMIDVRQLNDDVVRRLKRRVA